MAAIYGTVTFTDGSKSNGSIRISTSWSNENAFPKNGKYRLEFRTDPKRKITVYADGKKCRDVTVSGNDVRVDIRLEYTPLGGLKVV
ncbi:hypothetical protein GF339_04280 [candidate division KSB3 bacterium]|uniref:Uncharacterized protein n=1 Tax=candidate division KSB3 bacterium TaxID=2044937 RepID=A0A9D5JT62_9BACT|nr:hypothetical protein [candidate division KSB3 bacterium]MBD3323777.1 hypothetical protein [candidate division KSB3 bacterium]